MILHLDISSPKTQVMPREYSPDLQGGDITPPLKCGGQLVQSGISRDLQCLHAVHKAVSKYAGALSSLPTTAPKPVSPGQNSH